MLRGAIIGLGRAALDVHVPAWRRREDVEIVAVTDLAAGPRAAIRAHLPAARWHDSMASLLAGESLDFVDICTPPSSHAALVCRALRAGHHVLCEKPLVCSPREFASVVELAGRSGRVLRTVHNWHHAPIIRRTTDLVQQGAIGQVAHVEWHTLRTEPARGRGGGAGNWRVDPALAGGGILTDHGWHVFYLLQRWVGEWPISVSARLETRRHAPVAVEDTATVHVTYPRTTAQVFLTWAADRRQTGATLIGQGRRLALHDETLVLNANGHERRWSCPPALSEGSVHPDWFDPVLAEFLRAVTGASVADANLAEASSCAALESAARESSRRGGTPIPVRDLL